MIGVPLVPPPTYPIIVLGTVVSLGKNQSPKAEISDGVSLLRQQSARSVRQSKASSPSPMFSRVTRLLFWYVVPLKENLIPVPGKEGRCHRTYFFFFFTSQPHLKYKETEISDCIAQFVLPPNNYLQVSGIMATRKL